MQIQSAFYLIIMKMSALPTNEELAALVNLVNEDGSCAAE